MAKKPAPLITAVETYSLSRQLGQGGAGRVFAAANSSGNQFAVKLIETAKSSSEKTRRFKNELMFCLRNQHPNILTIADYGTFEDDGTTFSFYVMPLYTCTLRSLLEKSIPGERVLQLFVQALDGVEAAHLRGVIHRDLKPENILYDEAAERLVIADFGIARFSEEELTTLVETKDGTRLANFQYAAPEQRTKNGKVDNRADIFSLGLILHEMITGEVPQGTGFKTISSTVPSLAYLDDIANKMIRHAPADRFGSIADVKNELTARSNIFVQQQKIDALRNTVVPASDIADPLVLDPPRLESIDVDGGRLVFRLSKEPSDAWENTFKGISGVQFYINQGPRNFFFSGRSASINMLNDNQGQALTNNFKTYLAKAIEEYETQVREKQRQSEHDSRLRLRAAVEAEDRRLAIIKKIQI